MQWNLCADKLFWEEGSAILYFTKYSQVLDNTVEVKSMIHSTVVNVTGGVTNPIKAKENTILKEEIIIKLDEYFILINRGRRFTDALIFVKWK